MELSSRPLAWRCLALTASFETSRHSPACFAGIVGNFDGQGLSFGALQWNVGQGTLQPLLRDMLAEHRAVCSRVFGAAVTQLEALANTPARQGVALVKNLSWWRGVLTDLGCTPECQDIQVRHAGQFFQRALVLCRNYNLASERAAALFFDISVQNGSITPAVRTLIQADFLRLPAGASETDKMRIIARRRAAAAKPQFAPDVLSRKMTIAEGRGTVHGIQYDLQRDFSIGLTPLDSAPAAAA
jgi:hypothetical protein